MSDETTKELTQEEIRVRERNSFDAFNEGVAKVRQVRRDADTLRIAERKKQREATEVDPLIRAEGNDAGA